MNVNVLMPLDTKKKLPATTSEEDYIDLSLLEGWSAVSEEQKFFISVYFDLYPQRFKACVKAGVTESRVNKWINEDYQFNNLLNKVEMIHGENLASVQYQEAYVNPKIRTQQLQAMNQRGYEKKTTIKNQSLTIVGIPMNEILKIK